MMNHEERERALQAMKLASDQFYDAAVLIDNHPFREFTGVLNEYIKVCREAHNRGIDFSECSTHTGIELEVPNYSREYINEKLECIFQGQAVMTKAQAKKSVPVASLAPHEV